MAILGATVVVMSALLAQAMSEMAINNNEFLLYNKYYFKSRLRMYGEGAHNFGSYDFEITNQQLWRFEEHPHQKGCYIIYNDAFAYWRLVMLQGTGLIMYKGPVYDDQLFKLVPSGKNDGYYYIYSCYYPKLRIVKLGPEDAQVGSYSGNQYDDQLWKLVPRFQADVYTDQIFHFDNRQGSEAITREVSVTTGVVMSTESSVSNTIAYSLALEASLFGVTASAEFSQEISNSFTSSNEESWSKTETISFTIPPKKNFKVMQHKASFKGVIPQDSCTLMTNIKIFESDTGSFSDPDSFIIN